MYSLRWIPFGGYCAIEGEDGSSESEHSFAKISWYKKILILVAAIFVCLLLLLKRKPKDTIQKPKPQIIPEYDSEGYNRQGYNEVGRNRQGKYNRYYIF